LGNPFDEFHVTTEVSISAGTEAAAAADAETSSKTTIVSEDSEIFAGSFDGAEAEVGGVAGEFVGHLLASLVDIVYIDDIVYHVNR